MNHYVNLAQQIVTSNNQQAYLQMSQAICQPKNLQSILNSLELSQNLHFTFSQILSKSILKGEFCPINQTKSDDNSSNEKTNEKADCYSIIIPRLFKNIIHNHFQSKEYIRRSALNAIAVCFKDLCDNNKNLDLFVNLITSTLFPNFKLNPLFVSTLQGNLVFIQPSQAVVNYFMAQPKAFDIFNFSAKIFVQLIEYITMPTVYRSYYEYRRNIYTFRNTFLAPILNVSVEYHKIFHLEWKRNSTNSELINALRSSINLLQKIMLYPFSLTLHEYESEQDPRQNVVGLNSQIYFPTCYRNILCDYQFLDMIFEFYLFLLKQLSSINQLGDTIYSLIRILGRSISASVYTFNAQQERKQYRKYFTEVAISIMVNFRFYDSFYIDTLSDIFIKILDTYSSTDLLDKKQKLFQNLLYFCQLIIDNCPIKLQDGKKNPFNKAFAILNSCIVESKETTFQNYVNIKCEEIMNKAFTRLYSWQQAERLMGQYGYNKIGEIQCFCDLFQNMPIVFSTSLSKNLATLSSIPIQSQPSQIQTIWLHLCSLLLPSSNSTYQQSLIILKYFKVSKDGNTLACLHYIKVLMNQLLSQMENGLPKCKLWDYMQQTQGFTFQQFILYVIRLCKSNFQTNSPDLLDYSLQLFKDIYVKLQKNRDAKFDLFYDEVKTLIASLSTTIFENPKFYKRRVQLFSVISSIWINKDSYKHLGEIYVLISQELKTNLNQSAFLKYMYDLRGLLQPIESSESFQIIAERAIQDLEIILPMILNGENLPILFNEESFIKAFCNMVLQFVTDYTRRLTYNIQSDLPLQIYDLFKIYILQASQYQYPKCLITIWLKFLSLNVVQQCLPLPVCFKTSQSKQFPSLIREYFQNIHRVPLDQLESLYVYIQDKVDFLVIWWEEVVRRNLYPKVSLRDAVESRIAGTKKQKEQLAHLVYMLGKYQATYWDLSGFDNQRNFVKYFVQNYKDFRDN